MRTKLIACVAAALMLAGCTSGASPDKPTVIVPDAPGKPAKAMSPEEAGKAIPPPRISESDVTYARMMIEHHQQALDMAGLAPQRSSRDDVKRLADRVADSQGPEIAAMRAWLTRTGAPGHHNHDQMPGMASAEQVEALRAASGPAFDTLFLQLMAAHHEGAVTMATTVLQTGSDVFIQEMAAEQAVGQRREITIMRLMLGS